jgi:ABC-2 type transport system ATP-binding protein
MDTVSLSPIAPIQPDRPVLVQTSHLRKVYHTGFWLNQKVVTLQNCSLQVHQGETFGLLGQNGAGKTTLLKILLGIIRPTSGQGQLLGKPLGDRSVKQRVGYLPENPYFYDYLTGWEFLQYAAELFQIPPSLQQTRIPELLDLVGLARSAARRKQLRHPDIVFLDEPMSGLDPLGRYQIREIVLSLKSQGKTIFFNSHVLSDVEQICDRVAILARGELLCAGSLDELLGQPNLYQVKIRGGNPEVLKQWIPDLDFSWQGHLKGGSQDFVASLEPMNAQLLTMHLARTSLEEFFVQQLRQRGIYTSQ